MAKRLEIKGNFITSTDTVTGFVEHRLPTKNANYRIYSDTLHLIYINRHAEDFYIPLANVVDKNDVAFESQAILETFLNGKLGGQVVIDAFIQDSTAPLMVVKASALVTETTTSVLLAKDDYDINVVSAAGFVIGQYLTIYNQDENRVFFSSILGIAGLVITLDTPLDFEYPIGSFVSVGDANMNADGSIVPKIFGIRNPTGVDVPFELDITRIIFKCLTTGTNDLSKFGDIIGGLVRGIVLRRVDGEYRNIFNAKTNGDLKNLMYDFDIQAVSGNQQDGFTCRITFSGQEKFGSVIRIGQNEDLQLVIQDDLSTLTRFTMIAEGSQVTI